MKKLFSIILLVSYFSISAQKYISIKGKVTSNTQAIEFANITIKNQPIGTISNERGLFEFHIPDSLKNDTLIISCIGYYNYKKQLSKLKASDSIFVLKQKDIELDEIIVLPKDKTAKEIVTLALQNIKKNYSTKQHYLEGFYREISYSNDAAKRVIEAAIRIQEYGIKKNNVKDRIKVFQLRKSNDYQEYNWWARKMTKYIFGERNSLYSAYDSFDFINKKVHNEILKKCTFEYLEPTILDTSIVYKIKFSYTTSDKFFQIYGYLYINTDNYAILKIENYRRPIDKFFYALLANNKPYIDKTIRMYRKFKDKYYLNYLNVYGTVLYEGEVISKTEKPIKEVYLLINNIVTKKKDYEKIRLKDMEQKDVRLYEQEFEYHPDFWKNYNILLANPIDNKVKKELEKEKQLESQFEENSN